jgi:hypothetical protein
MADAICLQDWTSVQGNSGYFLYQAFNSMVEIPAYQDVAVYADISAVSNATLYLQTGADVDPLLWITMVNHSGALIKFSTVGTQAIQVCRSADFNLVGRFVRWAVSGTSTFSITFRVWLSLQKSPVR